MLWWLKSDHSIHMFDQNTMADERCICDQVRMRLRPMICHWQRSAKKCVVQPNCHCIKIVAWGNYSPEAGMKKGMSECRKKHGKRRYLGNDWDDWHISWKLLYGSDILRPQEKGRQKVQSNVHARIWHRIHGHRAFGNLFHGQIDVILLPYVL